MTNSSLSTYGNNSNSFGSIQLSSGFVVDVVTDDKHPRYNEVGGDIGIGAIFYQSYAEDATNQNLLSVAYPARPNITHFPIIGEVAFIVDAFPDASGLLSKNYYLDTINTSNSAQKNILNGLSETGSLSKNHIPLRGKSTDTILEGRNNGSIRFTSDNDGNGMLMMGISSVPTTSGSKRTEELNGNDSVIIMSSDQKIPVQPIRPQPTSFSPEPVPAKPKLILPNEEVIEIKEYPDDVENDIVPFTLIDYKTENYEKDELDVVEIRSPTQYEGNMTIDNTQNENNEVQTVTVPKRKVNISDFTRNAGGIRANLPNGVKSLLDVISFMEGTLGVSQNGYDVCFGGVLVKNWTPNYKLGHPNIVQTAKGVKTSACGRYQFLYSTWKGLPNSTFDKNGQDLNGGVLVKRRVTTAMYNGMENYFKTIEGACQVFAKIAPEWASFPNGSSPYTYYSDALNKGKSRYTQEQIRDLFLKAYSLYSVNV